MRTYTNSERNSFNCQQRWMWQYGLHVREAVEQPHFLRGALWHDIMDVYHDKGMNAAESKLERLRDEYLGNVFASDSDATEEDLQKFFAQYSKLLPAYHNRYKQDGLSVVETEVEYSMPVNDYLDDPLYYSGKVDKIVKDRDGLYWIVDHKTTTMDLNRWYELNKDSPQMTGYTLLAEYNNDYKIEGVIFDTVRMPAVYSNDIPEPTKSGVLRKYSVNLPSVTPEAWKTAMDRYGDYSDNAKSVLTRLVNRASEDCEMSRFRFILSDFEKSRLKTELNNILSQMDERYKALEDSRERLFDAYNRASFESVQLAESEIFKEWAGSFPRNHAECIRFGRKCPYADLCRYGNFNENEMKVVDSPHAELEEFITE